MQGAGRWLAGREARAERAGGRAWARGRALQAAGRAGVGRSGRVGVRSGKAGGGRRASWPWAVHSAYL